ncbi:MAG: hypothetical protein JWO03_1560 [Bacteroidetes bacterium]|nr:hypothetical protein [Bacteroidota bacterium]
MKYFSAGFYYVRYSILGKIIAYTYKKFSLKVWLLSIFFIFMFFLNQLIHLFFRLIDEVFFFKFKQVKIKQPVFIIANPRSGTTYLHRLISMDDSRFAYTKFAHTFFMTSSFTKFANLVKWVNRHTGRWISKSLDKADEVFWGGWDDIHAMGFNKAEEDELVFAQMMMSIGVFIPFPYYDVIHSNKFLDKEPPHVRKNTMDFYESCVKRFMHAAGKDRTYLSKNVMSTGRFKSLLERFPDAKIIYIARHPYEALPSMTSMFSVMYGSIPDDDPARLAFAELGIQFYLYLAEMRKVIPPSQFIALKYDDLVDKPKETVLKVYEHFNWEVSEQFSRSLDTEERRQKNYQSHHDYSLEKYSLSKEYIYERLFDVFHEFGFEK